MQISRRAVAELALATGAASASTVLGQVTNYTDRNAWHAVADPVNEIRFNELDADIPLSTQYTASLGATFVGNNFTVTSGIFLDLFGARGTDSFLTVQLASPTNSIAIDYAGAARIILYRGDTFVGSSEYFPGSSAIRFGGVTSTVAFDRVHFTDWFLPSPVIDNMYWSNVPAPAGITLLGGAIALTTFPRRRR